MAIGQVAHGRCQQGQGVLQALGDAFRGEEAHFRGGELDRQRQPLQAPADVGDGRGVLGGEGELGLDRLCAVDEQLHRRRSAGALHAHRRGALGRRQTLHLVHLLATDAQHDPARHQERCGRRDRVQPHQGRRGSHDLLEVVEHDQHAPTLQGVGDALLEARFAVVADAEEVGDRRQQEALLEHALQEDEEGAVGKEILGGVRDLDRETALSDPAGPDERHHPVLALLQQLAHLREVALTADRGRVRGGDAGDEGWRRLPVRARGLRPGLVEALSEQRGQIAHDTVGELVGVVEGEVRGGVVAADARDQLRQPLLAMVGRLDVYELRHGWRGEVVLVFQTADLLVGRDPSVAVAVDPDEDVALREVRPVELTWRVGARAQLEHHRGESHPLDRRPHRTSFVRELAQGRADEHPDPLVRRADRGPQAPSHEHIMA